MAYSTTSGRRQGATGNPTGCPPARPWHVLFWFACWATLVLLLAPAATLLEARIWLATWLPFAAQLDALDVTRNTDKWIHLGLFVLLCALGRQAWRQPAQRRPLLLGLLAMAGATEGLQHFVPGRSASLGDLLADVAGLALASVLVRSRRDWPTGAAPTQAP